MASNTENLDLLMKNPSTDGADTFNVQTMLNENWQKIDNNAGTVAQTLANILKPTTPPIIGLPPSATPNDMFNVLAHAGDLHVWRKTVTTAQEIPAGYKLVPVAMASTILMYLDTGRVTSSTPVLYYATEINISNNGNVAVESNGKLAGWYYNGTATISNYVPATGSGYTSITDNAGLQNLLRGKFVTLVDNPNSFQLPAYVSRDKIYQIPADATISFYHGYSLEGNNSVIVSVSKLNEVVGYPLTPAGTTTTYPVSTNSNAYQEGNDAKPAGYTLGEVVMGDYRFVNDSSATVTIYYADAPIVSDDGRTVDIAKNNGIPMKAAYSVSDIEAIKGKYIQIADGQKDYAGTPFNDGRVYYIPSNAMFSMSSGLYAATDRYQPVTGYAAIPANTTIEYLGCLGDKARVQVVSYVGTGTYGKSNPNSLTFDFVPKVAMMLYRSNGSDINNSAIYSRFFPLTTLTTSYKNVYFAQLTANGNDGRMKISEDRKTVSWFNAHGAYYQENESGMTYVVAAIG